MVKSPVIVPVGLTRSFSGKSRSRRTSENRALVQHARRERVRVAERDVRVHQSWLAAKSDAEPELLIALSSTRSLSE